MAITFGAAPTVINLDDPTPGGNVNAANPVKGPATVTDTTFPANDPWGSWLNQQKQDEQEEKTNKLAASSKAASDAADAAPSSVIPSLTGPTGVLASAGRVLAHPIQSASGILQGVTSGFANLADIPVRIMNFAAQAEGKPSSMQLPLPGQTMNQWMSGLFPNTPVSNAVADVAQQLPGYEAGGEGAKALGLKGIVAKVLGNVAGGQATTNATTAADRVKQAAFDTAFGVADEALGAVANKVKVAKAATAAVTSAKDTVTSNAITAFEKADSPAYNPTVAGKLRDYLDSAAYSKPKTMVDFEKGLQTTLGDDFYKPEVNQTLQPIIDAGHAQVAEQLGVKGIQPPAEGPIRPQDIFDTDTATAKAADQAGKKPPEIKYIPKDSLGRDPAGNKKMATTNVDTKTGNAIVYYDKSLDASPDAKQIIMDHEMGHILDKRLNGGNNLSAELPNYEGNKATLQNSLGDFAKQNGKTLSETVAALQKDIEALGGSEGKANNEQFADAVSMYKMDPKGASEMAPTFAKLMEYVPQDSRFTEHSTTLQGLKQDSPLAGKAVEDSVKKSKADAKEKLEASSKPGKSAGGKIASTGLDTGDRVKGKLSFNPDKIDAPEDVEKLFNRMDAENATFEKARMAKDNEQIKDLARLTGLKEEDLLKSRPGSIANAETLTAARQLVLNKAQALADSLKGVDIANASDEQLKDIKDNYAKLVAMQQSVAGLRTEAANTLRSLQIKISPEENFTLKEAFTKLQSVGIASNGDAGIFAGKVGKDLQQSLGGRITQGALKTWYATILSGPATPARHFIGVASNLVSDIASKGFNPATMNEVVPAITALFKSVPDAFSAFKETFKAAGEKAGDFNEFAKSGQQPIWSKGGFGSKYGKAVEMVGRTMDALASGYRTSAEAVEEASVAVNSAKMSADVQKALSSAYADSINYFGEPKGFIAQRVLASAKALTAGAYNPLKLLVPFTRIVTNILDRQFDYMPGTSIARAFDIDGGLTKQTDNLMTKYGLTSDTDRTAIFARLKNQQIGRMVMGIGVSAGVAELASKGLVSGNGPADYNQKIELERTGWRPNSVQIGGYWVPHIWFGPLGGIMSMAGNIADAGKYDKGVSDGDITQMISKGILGWGQSQLDNSFLSGVSNLLGALSDPTKAASYLKNFGSALIPIPKAITGTLSIAKGIVADTSGDPTQDEQYATRTIIDKVRSELGLTSGLQPSLNQFGEPLRADTIYGITPTLSKADAVDNYLSANDIVVTIPDANEKYTDPGTGGKIALTPDQYTAYVKASGQDIYQQLQQMIPNLQDEDIDTQRSQINAMVTAARTQARAEILSQ